MNPRSWFDGLTGYFVYILFIATLGPLLFGFHLVTDMLLLVTKTLLTSLGRAQCPRRCHPLQEEIYQDRRC
jgi:hypothetical protein